MLRISELKLHNFRSFGSFELKGLDRLTVLVGPNASGKTNAVEALSLLTTASSFRNASPNELVGRSGNEAMAQVRIEGDGRVIDLGMAVSEGKRKWLVNGKTRRGKDLKGILPSITFTPDDLQLAKGPDSIRRRELDIIGSQLNSNYTQISRDYAKILSHKNRLLKDGCSEAMLDAVDEVFATVAEQYSHYREALFSRLMPIHSSRYTELASSSAAKTCPGILQEGQGTADSGGSISRTEELSGIYMRSWEGDAVEALGRVREEEMARKRSLVGPHIDKIAYMLDGMDVTAFASQGQQRSVVLALKLAEVDLIQDMTGSSPLLLLDDVMSELDASRRGALVDLVSNGPQTFVTTANLDYFDERMLEEAKIVNLGRGFL